MAHLRTAPQSSGYGFDGSRNLLVLPVKGTCALYLVAGSELTVSIDPKGIAQFSEFAVSDRDKASPGLTPWERSQDLRGIKIEGSSLGSAKLNARLPNGAPFIAPLDIQVVADPDYRQFGDKGVSAPKLTQELGSLSFRDGLIRVAMDQMNSRIGRSPTGGDGRYGLKSGVNWCGAFVHWCYQAVATATGKPNPFGPATTPLDSPQKAIGWALHNPDKAELLRYSGPDPYGWTWDARPQADKTALTQAFVDIDASHPVMKGDVCLVRESLDPAAGWKHVCMVVAPPDPSGAFTTVDGNQTGAFRPGSGFSNDCIGLNSHDAKKKLSDGTSYAFVFLHVKTI